MCGLFASRKARKENHENTDRRHSRAGGNPETQIPPTCSNRHRTHRSHRISSRTSLCPLCALCWIKAVAPKSRAIKAHHRAHRVHGAGEFICIGVFGDFGG